MNTRSFNILAALLILQACSKSPAPLAVEQRIKYVDPFIGTAEHGHTFPGATVPFGAVQLSPDNGTNGWDWCSGYNYADSIIAGFSHTHLSGTGIGDLCDISLMPTTKAIDFAQAKGEERMEKWPWAAGFKHNNEQATPGYYAVSLDNGIQVELTATTHAGLHRYTFPEGAAASVVLDLGFAINWDRPLQTGMTFKAPNLITGYRYSTGWARDQRVYFALEFSVPVSGFTLADSTAMLTENVDFENIASKFPDEGALQGRLLRGKFDFQANKEIQLKVGLSSSGEAGALAALKQVPGWDFDQVKSQAETLWEKELAKISVQTTDESIKKTFYTAIYRSCLAPVIYSDATGAYKASTKGEPTGWNFTPPFPNGAQAGKAAGFTRYGIFSLWDTFRAAHPLYTITQPDRVNDFIRSILAHYEEYGLLPIWELLGNETNTMTGYHAIPVIADAWTKGYRDFDIQRAFAAMKKSAQQDIRGSKYYRQYGYIPYELEGESVTKTLEYAFDDWCIAQIAGALGQQADQDTFLSRAQFYKNMFDPSTGFMRAKLTDGSWKVPFDPRKSDHNFEVAEYTEGNAWQHAWFVPHDVAGLMALHGSKDKFIQKLDSLFSISSEVTGDNVSADVSGLIGQYAHGNEPSHHIAYFYNYAGVPWKTQEMVRHIMESQYNNTPAGLCGNEDCGQMSAWYVWNAMGLYPVNPASGRYDIGSPLFEKTTIDVAPIQAVTGIQNALSSTFVMEAEGVSKTNKYIQSATLNGQPLDRPWLTHAELAAGGTLVLNMGPNHNEQLWRGE